jgi:hypothetical protein
LCHEEINSAAGLVGRWSDPGLCNGAAVFRAHRQNKLP